MTTTLRDLFETQYRVLKLRNSSPDSHRLYGLTLKSLDRYLQRPTTLDDLNDVTISQYVLHLRDKGNAPGTINRHLTNVLALWRWCHRQQLVEHWPNVKKERDPVRTPVAWTREEFNRLMQAINRQDGTIPGTEMLKRDWWTALLLLAFDTGERIGALRKLRWETVSLETRDVIFRAETRKGRQRDNAMTVSEQTANALKRIQRPSGLVFQSRYCSSYLWQQLGRILESAGLPSDRAHKFHCVRKTTASHYKAAGGDAGRLLGHMTNVSTAHYIDPKIARQPAAHEIVFRPTVPQAAKGRSHE